MRLTLLILFVGVLLSFPLSRGYAQAQKKNGEPGSGNSSRPGSITGSVLADGEAVVNATVTASRLGSGTQVRTVPTNDIGEFTIKGLGPGLYRIAATAPTYVSSDQEQESIYRIGDSVRLMMMKGGVITGKVVDSHDEPIVGVRISAMLIRDRFGKVPMADPESRVWLTDDRGVYRIFGLRPGTYVVFAGGRGSSKWSPTAYDKDAVTYAPASTRDTAEEIPLGAGEEKTVNINYRSKLGHSVTGTATSSAPDRALRIHVSLARFVNDISEIVMSFDTTNGGAFDLAGVGDGDYIIWAESDVSAGDVLISDPQRVKVNGSDVTGLKLIEKPLANVTGQLVLERLNAGPCGSDRRPVSINQILVSIRRNGERSPKERSVFWRYQSSQALSNDTGHFVLHNLDAGQYSINVLRLTESWYLRSVLQQRVMGSSKAVEDSTAADLARTALEVKSGDRVSGIKIVLAEGAASIFGQVEEGDRRVPDRLFAYLVPSEKDRDEVLRYSVVPVNTDGSFAFNHVPPGRYRTLLQVTSEPTLMTTRALRLPVTAKARAQLEKEAQSSGSEINLKPCQEAKDYKLQLR